MDRTAVITEIDETTAEELNVSRVEAQSRREKMMARNKRLLAVDTQIVLSDEQSGEDDDDAELSLFGQKLESNPDERSTQLAETIDFGGISAEELFGKRREVYRLKAEKLDGLVDC